MGSPSLLDESDLVANSETILEEEGTAEALHRALAHNSYTVAKHVCFVHIMSRQNDNSVLFVGLKHVPEVSSRAKVHSSRGFIEEYEL